MVDTRGYSLYRTVLEQPGYRVDHLVPAINTGGTFCGRRSWLASMTFTNNRRQRHTVYGCQRG